MFLNKTSNSPRCGINISQLLLFLLIQHFVSGLHEYPGGFNSAFTHPPGYSLVPNYEGVHQVFVNDWMDNEWNQMIQKDYEQGVLQSLMRNQMIMRDQLKANPVKRRLRHSDMDVDFSMRKPNIMGTSAFRKKEEKDEELQRLLKRLGFEKRPDQRLSTWPMRYRKNNFELDFYARSKWSSRRCLEQRLYITGINYVEIRNHNISVVLENNM